MSDLNGVPLLFSGVLSSVPQFISQLKSVLASHLSPLPFRRFGMVTVIDISSDFIVCPPNFLAVGLLIIMNSIFFYST